MLKSFSLLTVALCALLVAACDAGSSSSDDSVSGASAAGSAAGAPAAGSGSVAGAPAAGSSGAHAGASGAVGAAGSLGTGTVGAGSGSILGTGGPFAFPQSKKPASCTLTSVANASASVQAAYNSWKAAMVTSNGAGGALRVQRNTDGNDTVSEGIGYGMIIAVYMNDKATFDGLWSYAKAHFDANGLMNWHIDAGGTMSANGAGSATDGDEDMGWALLMASDQWSSAQYLADGKAVITAIATGSIGGDGVLKPGDGWGGTTVTFPDYFSPAYYRVFAKATNNPNWSGIIIDRNYAILAAVSGNDGLVPDKTDTNTTPYTVSANYSYDACRTPWRISMDYCFNGEPRAKTYIDKVGPFFNGVGAGNIVDGYANSGSQTGNSKNMAFTGPAGVAGMAGYPALLDGAFSFGVNNSGDGSSYYSQSLRVITMLMMSGNFVDFSKP